MGYSLLEFMKRLGIFIVCAQSLLHFTAGKSYEKYVRLLVGMMILAQFVVPVRALFLGRDNAQIWDQVERFQTEMSESLGQIEAEDFSANESDDVTAALEEEMKERLEEAAASLGYLVDRVEVRTGEEEAKLTVIVIPEGEKGKRIRIDRVEVGALQETGEPAEKEEELREAFASCLGTDREAITVRQK